MRLGVPCAPLILVRVERNTLYNDVMHQPLVTGCLRRFVVALLAAGSLVIIGSCWRRDASEQEVWAKVEGRPIFRDEVERVYRSRMAAGSDAGSPEQSLSFKLNILNELINKEILETHASRSRITVSEAEVDTKIGELQSPYSKEEFVKKIKEQGIELSELRGEIRQSLMINKLINKDIVSRITVSDAEIADYYARNKSNFNVPETQYHLAQIEVTPRADSEVRNLKNDDAKTPAAAQRKIRALYAQLRTGEDFAKVAQEYSEDPRTAASGGDMGFVPASSLGSNPALKQAVISLKVGETSGILRTPTGYHIVKLLSREDAGEHPLSDPQVQGTIRQTLLNEKEQLMKAAYIETLRNRVKVVNYLADQILSGRANQAASK